MQSEATDAPAGAASPVSVDASSSPAAASALLAQALPTASADLAAAVASAPAAAAPTAPTPAPALAGQLSGPVTQLVTQPDGNHTVVVRVVPEQLGPVRVDAHLTEHGLRIELSAPTDAGRDALSGVLGELRRDLAAGGITASVSLGSAGASADGQPQQGSQQALFELFDEQRTGRPLPTTPAQPRGGATAASAAALSADSILDVLA
jgi:flagellar hook-length control protein FliK